MSGRARSVLVDGTVLEYDLTAGGTIYFETHFSIEDELAERLGHEAHHGGHQAI
jgi:hypothetical protein